MNRNMLSETVSEAPSKYLSSEPPRWWVYMVRTTRQALYTGIATDIERRIAEHNGQGSRGAKALRGQRPVNLVWKQGALSQGEALRLERHIKSLKKTQKENVVAGQIFLSSPCCQAPSPPLMAPTC